MVKTNLDENEVYWLDKNSVIAIHLSNKPTGQRDSSGRLKDNIKNEGWFLFKGSGVGKMRPIRKLTERQAIAMINRKLT